MDYTYTTKGVCSRQIHISVEGDTVTHVQYVGGCPGNVIGVARLAENRNIDELLGLLEGVRCGMKPTSCPDQLAQALKAIKAGQTQA